MEGVIMSELVQLANEANCVLSQQASPINSRGCSVLFVSLGLARGPRTRTKEGRRSEGGQGERVSLVIRDLGAQLSSVRN